jgi:bifunctional non-homologous end joining protein LigD
MPKEVEILNLDGHEVTISNPSKSYFSQAAQVTKLQLVQFYLSVSAGALLGVRDRPFVLKRFVNGAHAEPFYQKRAPDSIPPFVRTVTLSFPSGRTADEVVLDNPAALAWAVNLGCIELHPHPVRTGDLDRPDELRIDLDPGPGVPWDHVRLVALEAKVVLDEAGLSSFPKTSGSRGMHLNVRIEPRWSFTEVRRAALALARAVERRAPTLATSKWWKEERHGVFLDYNQNAKDRTTCSAYSVRPLPDARVSTPLHWDEVADADPADFTVFTVPQRFAQKGDPAAGIDGNPGSLHALLELAARDEAEGLGDAPWPPHFAKAEGEPKRVQPSKAKSFSGQLQEGFGAQRFRKRSQGLASGATELQADSPAASIDDGIKHDARSLADEESVEAAVAKTAARKTAVRKTPMRKTASRKSTMPLVTVAQSPDRAAVDAGLVRWREAHPEASALLAEDDVLVDRMRGSAYVWYRIRLNLRHVPEAERPAQTTPDPDDDPTRKWREGPA